MSASPHTYTYTYTRSLSRSYLPHDGERGHVERHAGAGLELALVQLGAAAHLWSSSLSLLRWRGGNGAMDGWLAGRERGAHTSPKPQPAGGVHRSRVHTPQHTDMHACVTGRRNLTPYHVSGPGGGLDDEALLVELLQHVADDLPHALSSGGLPCGGRSVGRLTCTRGRRGPGTERRTRAPSRLIELRGKTLTHTHTHTQRPFPLFSPTCRAFKSSSVLSYSFCRPRTCSRSCFTLSLSS